MKRKFDKVAHAPEAAPRKEHRTAPSSHPPAMKQRKAVPPGYLHDLLHARHLMNIVGLRGPPAAAAASRQLGGGGGGAAGSGRAGPMPAAALGRSSHLQLQKRLPCVPANTLPLLMAQRKKYLRHKKQRDRGQTPYQQRPGEPVGLLSMPEDVLLKIVCYLKHDEIKPMFQTCKQLGHTLREAIRFHFNFATPFRPAPGEPTPVLKRPDRKRAVTALADVLAHLQRGQRHAAPGTAKPPGSTHSTGPRALRFATPSSTPRPMPLL